MPADSKIPAEAGTLPAGASILVVGGGKMGSALVKGWLDAGTVAEKICIVEPDAERRQMLVALGDLKLFSKPEDLPKDLAPELMLVAIKPQHFDTVLPLYQPIASSQTLILSIAAGRLITSLQGIFGPDQPIVRAMPNTPAAVGRGISVLCANKNCSSAQLTLAQSLMSSVGEVVWIKSEDLMHVVTALSGGGPAYVFLLVEAMARAGSDLGLPDDLSMRLARATVAGSGELLRHSDQPAAILRSEVTSPGGTTQAALKILMAEHGLPELFAKAIANADQRSRELA